jgi:hypothetical protein
LLDLKAQGVIVSESVLNRLRTERVLELQCKASERPVDSKNVLYFGYRRETRDKPVENTVSVQKLVDAFNRAPWQTGLLKRFLRVQEILLSRGAEGRDSSLPSAAVKT